MKKKNFESKKNQKINLKNWDTQVDSLYSSEKEGLDQLDLYRDHISELQEKLYAQRECSVLVILQGLDTSGKDGVIKHVFSGINPQGCEVTSFKQPSELERGQDFLWRTHRRIPARGKIGIFNRSYYEDIIVPFVHSEALDESYLPRALEKGRSRILLERCKDIVCHEEYLARQGVLVVKFFLHLSEKEQKFRLQDRLKDPSKHWKISESDFTDRKFWKTYQRAYEFCIQQTSHQQAPWYMLPADDKLNLHLILAQVLIKKMKELKLEYPSPPNVTTKNLARWAAMLEK